MAGVSDTCIDGTDNGAEAVAGLESYVEAVGAQLCQVVGLIGAGDAQQQVMVFE